MSHQIQINRGVLIAVSCAGAGAIVYAFVSERMQKKQADELRSENRALLAQNAKLHRALTAQNAKPHNRKGWFKNIQIGAAVATIIDFFSD